MKNMMKFRKTTIVLSALVAVYLVCSAHFIWTETAGIAVVGREHPVNLFFGEVNFYQKEVAGGRLDEMEGLKSVYIDAKNEVKELPLTKQQDRFTAKFIPDQAGVYQVLTSNEVAKVMDLRKSGLGIVKPMYYSRQIVLCTGKTNTSLLKAAAIQPYFDLDIIPDFTNSRRNTFAVGQPVNFYSYFRKMPVKGGKIFAHAPNGWSKEIDADDKGLCTFIPLWEGQYVIDWVYTENSPGKYMDTDFGSYRYRAVLTIHVAK